MKKGLIILSIITVLITLSNINANSQDWNYIGFSKLNNETIFYVFSMKKGASGSGYIELVQKHIFGKPQKLKDGREYDSMLIDRTLDCSNRSMSVDKIVISNGIGNRVDTYSNTADKGFKKIDNDRKIDLKLYNQYCN